MNMQMSDLMMSSPHNFACASNLYVRASASETYILGLKIHLHYAYTINAVPVDYFWYGAINNNIYRQNTKIEKHLRICERV